MADGENRTETAITFLVARTITACRWGVCQKWDSGFRKTAIEVGCNVHPRFKVYYRFCAEFYVERRWLGYHARRFAHKKMKG